MAPELRNKPASTKADLRIESDVYSFGMVVIAVRVVNQYFGFKTCEFITTSCTGGDWRSPVRLLQGHEPPEL